MTHIWKVFSKAMSTSIMIGVVHEISALTGPSADRLNQHSVSIKQATVLYMGALGAHKASARLPVRNTSCSWPSLYGNVASTRNRLPKNIATGLPSASLLQGEFLASGAGQSDEYLCLLSFFQRSRIDWPCWTPKEAATKDHLS